MNMDPGFHDGLFMKLCVCVCIFSHRWGKKSSFKSKCVEVREECCFFKKLPSIFGMHYFKVKTHLQGQASDWAENTTTVVKKS